MRRFLPIALVATLALVANISPAGAKTISDPNETGVGIRIDIKSVTLVKPSAGKLSWKLVSWDSFTSKSIEIYFPLRLFLDVRNTDKADYRVEIYWDNISVGTNKLVCAVTTRSGSAVEAGKVSRPSSSSAKCVFSTSGFSKNKTVRWRAESVGINSTDKAPNTGWVKGA